MWLRNRGAPVFSRVLQTVPDKQFLPVSSRAPPGPPDPRGARMAGKRNLFSPTCNRFVSSLFWHRILYRSKKVKRIITHMLAEQEFQEKLIKRKKTNILSTKSKQLKFFLSELKAYISLSASVRIRLQNCAHCIYFYSINTDGRISLLYEQHASAISQMV